jgi:excisionase family DNA binding protein
MLDAVRFLTVPQVAEMIQLTEARIYEAVRQNLLPAVHIGRQVRIEESVFLEWARSGGKTHANVWSRSN